MLVDVDRNSIQTEKPSKRPLWKRGTASSKPIPTAFSKLSIFLPVPFFAKNNNWFNLLEDRGCIQELVYVQH